MPHPVKLLCILFLMLFAVDAYSQKNTTPVQINEVRFNLPGNWERLVDRKESGQYGFIEKNTKVNIAISVRKPEYMEFYKPEMNEWQLVDTFYKWDAEYWSSGEGINATVKKLKEDTVKKIIFWSVEIKQGENIFLFGLKDGKIISINLNNANEDTKMNATKAMEYLETIFES